MRVRTLAPLAAEGRCKVIRVRKMGLLGQGPGGWTRLPTRAELAGACTAHAPDTEHVDEWPCRRPGARGVLRIEIGAAFSPAAGPVLMAKDQVHRMRAAIAAACEAPSSGREVVS